MEQTIDEIAEDYQATIDTCRYEYGDEYGYHLGRVGYEDYKDLVGGVLEAIEFGDSNVCVKWDTEFSFRLDKTKLAINRDHWTVYRDATYKASLLAECAKRSTVHLGRFGESKSADVISLFKEIDNA